jgi:hypothetical protein
LVQDLPTDNPSNTSIFKLVALHIESPGKLRKQFRLIYKFSSRGNINTEEGNWPVNSFFDRSIDLSFGKLEWLKYELIEPDKELLEIYKDSKLEQVVKLKGKFPSSILLLRFIKINFLQIDSTNSGSFPFNLLSDIINCSIGKFIKREGITPVNLLEDKSNIISLDDL